MIDEQTSFIKIFIIEKRKCIFNMYYQTPNLINKNLKTFIEISQTTAFWCSDLHIRHITHIFI
jgi:hypothetical protein